MAPVNRPLSVSIERKVFPRGRHAQRDRRPEGHQFHGAAAARFVVITGPSGSGKSTMLNIIAGLDKDYDGKIDLGGSGDNGLTFVFQSPRLLALAHGV